MRDIIHFFVHRWLRLIGGLMVFVSLGLLIFMLLLDLLVGLENPYLGILTYMILPGILTIGLILVPLDSFLRRRRIAAGRPDEALSLSIDLTDPKQKRLFVFFSGATMFILVVATVATYKALEFMDTKTFCGLTCHRVMKPQYAAYNHSSHASVSCVACHIGPGAPWFVRSKLSGIPQVYHYTRGSYPRPIPTPVPALRPSRDTCENCHWPERFYGNSLRTAISYATDEQNTMSSRTMIMNVGSGAVTGSGIHSHIVNDMWYLPANARLTEVAWVKVERVDGTVAEYINPQFQGELNVLQSRQRTRFMDCIDCHNRAAHEFVGFEALLDEALTQGAISGTIPYIKREAMAAAPDPDRVPTAAEDLEALRRIDDLPNVYRQKYPDVYNIRQEEIEAAAEAVKTIYSNSTFSHMRISAHTYPNWVTHEGCFRCHGALVKHSGDARESLDRDCMLCHSLPEANGIQ